MSDEQNQNNLNKPVEQTRDALEQAIGGVKSPEHADAVIEKLERAAAGKTEQEVAERKGQADSATAAEAIQSAAEAPAEPQPEDVILEAAEQIAGVEDDGEELLSEGAQQAAGIEDEPVAPPKNEEERRLLQEALLRRLNPLNAADTAIFLTINNRMPRTRLLNQLMHALTTIMNRGDGWVLGLLLATARDKRRGRRALMDVLPALWLTTAAVEYPIKSVFRRRRPFISLVRAIVVGRKPGGYSFPSGHSAAAFAGAVLLSRHYPRWRAVFYSIASLVGFSRVYLGAHYPGDVISGGITGSVLAVVFRRLVRKLVRAFY